MPTLRLNVDVDVDVEKDVDVGENVQCFADAGRGLSMDSTRDGGLVSVTMGVNSGPDVAVGGNVSFVKEAETVNATQQR